MVTYMPHRGSLSDAIKETREFDSVEDMLRWICDDHNSRIDYFAITPEEICIIPDRPDERVGWNNGFMCLFERPSEIKNFEGCKKYFGIEDEEDDDAIINDYPLGIIGTFSTDYNRKDNENDYISPT